MFRSIVQTAFGSGRIALVEKALAELAIGHRQSFFIPDDSVIVEGLLERRDRLFPPPFTSLLEREVVVKNAECAIVFQCAEEIQCFEVIGTGFFRMVGADVKIAEIHQRVGDSLLIPLRTLYRKDFSITGFRAIEIARECANIAEIAERIGERSVILGQAIIRDCLFVGGSGLSQLAAMKKNARAMFVVVRHFQCRSFTLPLTPYPTRIVLVSSLWRVFSKLDLNLILFIEPQSIAK